MVCPFNSEKSMTGRSPAPLAFSSATICAQSVVPTKGPESPLRRGVFMDKTSLEPDASLTWRGGGLCVVLGVTTSKLFVGWSSSSDAESESESETRDELSSVSESDLASRSISSSSLSNPFFALPRRLTVRVRLDAECEWGLSPVLVVLWLLVADSAVGMTGA